MAEELPADGLELLALSRPITSRNGRNPLRESWSRMDSATGYVPGGETKTLEEEMMAADPIAEFLCVISAQLADGARPQRVNTPFGEVELTYDRDEDDESYVFVSYPGQLLGETGWLTEIDDKTYGRMFGFRRYLNDGEGVAG